MPQLKFPHHHTYAEMTEYLQDVAQAFPLLTHLQSMGQSYQGRELWVLTLTNTETGPDHEKPAYWIDANIHASEITGGATALWTIDFLLKNYGKSDADGREVTYLLDHFAIYIAPRISPDGVEAFLTTPRQIRSSLRKYPYQDNREGLHPEDIDGDGRILQMRIRDPKGPWKVSEKDPRLMRRRDFNDHEGIFYQVYTEGLIHDYDGYIVKNAPPKYGLDLNRNFPIEWAPEGQQRGAGPFPASEPETRAIAEFFSKHKNINGAQSYHTYSGVLLRPYAGKSDDTMPTHDLTVFNNIGELGTKLTGYPHTSVFHGFRYDPKQILHGGFFDWLYDSLGIFAFANELWDVVAEAGIGEKQSNGILKRNFIGWLHDHPEEDDLKLLHFNDEHQLDGFEEWRSFNHPQLGQVEIGGWDYKRFWGVAPFKFLPDIAERHTRFTLAHAAASPRLNWKLVKVQSLADQVFRVLAILENVGHLPTYTSAKALERQAINPIEIKLETGDSEIATGAASQEIGHLDGRSAITNSLMGNITFKQECKLEWVIHGEAGSMIYLEAHSQRAGVARYDILLKDLAN